MIPANELRIGNWYNCWQPAKMKDTPTQFKEFGQWEQFMQTWVNPIPLTPSILEKCGFENFQPSSWYRLNRWFELKLIEGVVFEYDLYRGSVVQLIHLHHLQNLYFSLSGEELSITL